VRGPSSRHGTWLLIIVDEAIELQEVYERGMTFCLRLLPNGRFEIRCGDYLHNRWPHVVAGNLEEAVLWLTKCSHSDSQVVKFIHGRAVN
jgi:hypothetical protein